jgi:hypothetical protein
MNRYKAKGIFTGIDNIVIFNDHFSKNMLSFHHVMFLLEDNLLQYIELLDEHMRCEEVCKTMTVSVLLNFMDMKRGSRGQVNGETSFYLELFNRKK